MNNTQQRREDKALERFARAIGYMPTTEQIALAWEHDARNQAHQGAHQGEEEPERWDGQG